MKVDLLDPRTALAQMVRSAEQGEEVLVSRYGVAVAQIVLLSKPKPKRRRMVNCSSPICS
jgi:antitoxin (DNA-binding transcriptional repressor) of toxin-antitoxin stability system